MRDASRRGPVPGLKRGLVESPSSDRAPRDEPQVTRVQVFKPTTRSIPAAAWVVDTYPSRARRLAEPDPPPPCFGSSPAASARRSTSASSRSTSRPSRSQNVAARASHAAQCLERRRPSLDASRASATVRFTYSGIDRLNPAPRSPRASPPWRTRRRRRTPRTRLRCAPGARASGSSAPARASPRSPR